MRTRAKEIGTASVPKACDTAHTSGIWPPVRPVSSEEPRPCSPPRTAPTAVEVMLGSPTVKELILRGDIGGLKEIMEKSKDRGMKTFDMALFDLCQSGVISEEDALRNADSENNLRLRLKLSAEQPDQSDRATLSLEDAAF